MSKVKKAYKEIEDVLGSDFISDKDPNYLLSPNKFHLHTYDTKFKDYYVEED